MREQEKCVRKEGNQGKRDLELVVVALDQRSVAVIRRRPVSEVHDTYA